MALHHIGHELMTGRTPVSSRDGTRVYLVCGCGRPRVVSREEWAAELARREQVEASHQAHQQRLADAQAAWEARQSLPRTRSGTGQG